MNNKKYSENGSVTVFLSCILLPIIIFELFVFSMAQQMAGKALVRDAKVLAYNGILAGYNRPINDVYAIKAYTKPISEVQSDAEYYMSESLPGNISVSSHVSYTGPTLNTNEEILSQIDWYMRNLDKSVNSVSANSVNSMSNVIQEIPGIINRLDADVAAANAPVEEPEKDEETEGDDAGTEGEDKEEEESFDYNWYSKIRQSNRELLFCSLISFKGNDDGYPAYNKNNMCGWERENEVYTTDEQEIEAAKVILNNMYDYYGCLDSVANDITSRNSNHMLALYAAEEFSCGFRHCDYNLSGEYYSSGKIKHRSFVEREYILYGSGNSAENVNNLKKMIYNTFFALELVHVMNDDYYIQLCQPKAEILARGDEKKKNVIVDAMLIETADNLARSKIYEIVFENKVPIVSNDSQTDWGDYVYFTQLFMMVEVNRDKDGVMNRMKTVIECNAQDTGGEAAEFTFFDAYTDIDFYTVHNIKSLFFH